MIWIGAGGVALGLLIIARLYVRSRRIIGLDGEVVLANMVIRARKYVGLFGAARPLAENRGLVAALVGKHDCVIEIMLRADVDVSSVNLLAVCKNHHNIRLWVERHPRQDLGGHFVTVDDRHAILARYNLTEEYYLGKVSAFEFRSFPTLAGPIRKRFVRLCRERARELDKTRIVEEIRQYARFTALNQGKVRPATSTEIAAVAAALDEIPNLAA
ncbi:MAG: hypothetical protein Q7N87_01970 [Candidatus Uhrbacteria bacterium]|nr:hypothetical protein [Candidatus Uhrbacteria bacterium]